MPTFDSDSFDGISANPARTGAHRGPRPRGHGWKTLAWAALATGVLVGIGTVGILIVNDRIQFTDSSTAAPTAEPTTAETTEVAIAPIVDPAAIVTVLNGTEAEGLAVYVGDRMFEAGWAGVGTMANASATDFTTTTVYYSDPAYEAAALGLAGSLLAQAQANAAELGVELEFTEVPIELSDQFLGANLTVVVGADFVAPEVLPEPLVKDEEVPAPEDEESSEEPSEE